MVKQTSHNNISSKLNNNNIIVSLHNNNINFDSLKSININNQLDLEKLKQLRTFNVYLYGDPKTGKNHLITRLTASYLKNKELSYNIQITFKIISNKADLNSLIKIENTKLLFIFDFSNIDSFNNISVLLHTLAFNYNLIDKALIIGNKIDLPVIQVNHDYAKIVCEELNLNYMGISALHNLNISKLLGKILI